MIRLSPALTRTLVTIVVILGFVIFVKVTLLQHAGACSESERATKERLASLTTCTADSECTSVRLNCPFECVTPVNRLHVQSALQAASEYARDCMMVCPDCPAPVSVAIRCIDSKCRV